MTRAVESYLRNAFERSLRLIKCGDEVAYSQTIERDIGTSAVVIVLGGGITYEVISAVEAIMVKLDRNGVRIAQ